jgi:hypothetical protein
MKPNFALSLSILGIRLLHRANAGWRVLGEVAVDADDVTSELAMLRKTAASLEPGGVRCKLVIPNDQIRYLKLDAADLTPEGRQDAARKALDGATPYAVDDLAFDVSVRGTELLVAAVARETLDEAEAFAVTHRFHPVSFVATPAEGDFDGEPFFGPTTEAADLLEPDQSVTRDSAPIKIVTGTADRNRETPKPAVPVTQTAEPDALAVPGFSSRRTAPPRAPAVEPKKVFAEPVVASGQAAMGFAEPRIPPAPAFKQQVKPPVRAKADTASVVAAKTPAQGSRRLLLVLMVALLLFLAGVAAWASVNFAGGLASLFNNAPKVVETSPTGQFVPPQQPFTADTPAQGSSPQAVLEQVSLDVQLTDEDAAVLDALRVPALPEPSTGTDWSDEELRAQYAVSGIWPIAPDVPSPPALIEIEDLYVTSIDPISPAFDAVALPQAPDENPDYPFKALSAPAPAGTKFTLDERGLVSPSADGTLNPDGVLVFAGQPPARPPATLTKIETPGEDPAVRAALAGQRPQSRPQNLQETTERATLDGLTRSELAELRPKMRPQSEQETAEESAQQNALASASLLPQDAQVAAPLSEQGEEDPLADASALAVAASLRPDARPKNFNAIVDQAKRVEPSPAPPPTVAAVAVTPRVVTPKIPSSASVSREATTRNAINLRQVNLIGVYGKPSDRRALIRLPNGRYKKVQIGDRIDGGRISAIGDSELRYQKSGRNIVLKMPKG